MRMSLLLGSPLTPNGLNGGKASFSDFHNVYIEPGSYGIYRKTKEFPEETIFFKELRLVLPGDQPIGSRAEAFGRGYAENSHRQGQDRMRALS